MTNDDVKLNKECPLCGRPPMQRDYKTAGDESIVFCNNADCGIFKYGVLKSRWNTRTTPDVSELVEALKDGRDALSQIATLANINQATRDIIIGVGNSFNDTLSKFTKQ